MIGTNGGGDYRDMLATVDSTEHHTLNDYDKVIHGRWCSLHTGSDCPQRGCPTNAFTRGSPGEGAGITHNSATAGCTFAMALLATASDGAIVDTPARPGAAEPTPEDNSALLDTQLAIPAAFTTAVNRCSLRLRPWWCKQFLTPKGCKYGTSCRFPHLTSTEVDTERRVHRAATATRCSEALSLAMRSTSS